MNVKYTNCKEKKYQLKILCKISDIKLVELLFKCEVKPNNVIVEN